MAHNVYDERNIQTMETVWGRGYMSPGGDAEVRRIVAEVSLVDAKILDFGCGVGGASIELARLGEAAKITSVDIESSVLERAHTLASEAGVGDKIDWRLIEPGPLPFEEDTFDVVYANSVTCHIPDLSALASDIVRVLKPGGEFIGSEWYVGKNSAAFKSWNDLLGARGLNFYFVDQKYFESQLRDGGFRSVRFVDRTAAMCEIARDGQARVLGELRKVLEDSLGAQAFDAFSAWGQHRADVLQNGGMLHGHFFAQAS